MSGLTYTKAIKNGRLKTTEMEVGSSFQGTVKAYEDGKFGKVPVVEIAGREVRIAPSGNFKLDVNNGKIAVGSTITVTRVDDIELKNGFKATQYDIQTRKANASSTQDVKEKLQAIRSGANS